MSNFIFKYFSKFFNIQRTPGGQPGRDTVSIKLTRQELRVVETIMRSNYPAEAPSWHPERLKQVQDTFIEIIGKIKGALNE